MLQLDKFTEYQDKIVKKLIDSQEIVDLLLNQTNSEIPNSDLIDDQIHIYEYVPEVDDTAKSYICIDGDIDADISINEIPIQLYIFTHKSLMIDRNKFRGTRVNNLVNEIDKLLNDSDGFGIGKIKLESVDRFFPAKDYRGKIMTYTIKDFNQNRKF